MLQSPRAYTARIRALVSGQSPGEWSAPQRFGEWAPLRPAPCTLRASGASGAARSPHAPPARRAVSALLLGVCPQSRAAGRLSPPVSLRRALSAAGELATGPRAEAMRGRPAPSNNTPAPWQWVPLQATLMPDDKDSPGDESRHFWPGCSETRLPPPQARELSRSAGGTGLLGHRFLSISLSSPSTDSTRPTHHTQGKPFYPVSILISSYKTPSRWHVDHPVFDQMPGPGARPH